VFHVPVVSLRRRAYDSPGMRVLFVAAAAVALMLPLAATGEVWPGPSRTQWIDAGHAWRFTSGIRLQGQNFPGFVRTSDGGRSWQNAYIETDYGNSREAGSACCRGTFTGSLTGFVSVSDCTDYSAACGKWTRDGGRHWYRTRRIGSLAGGWNHLLLYAVGKYLYRVTPLPPRGDATSMDARMRATVVPGYFDEDGEPQALQGFPGHVAVLDVRFRADGGIDNIVKIVDSQGRVVRTSVLSTSLPGRICAYTISYDPRAATSTGLVALVVHGTRYSSGDCSGFGQGTTQVTWRSADSGASWNIER
jgi:hypothetical protein